MNQGTPTAPTGRGRIRRVQAGILATATAALSLGALAAPSASAARLPQASSAKTTIEWWASPISTSGPDLRMALITAFEKAYPNITVNLQTAPTNTDTNEADLETTISGGATKPDVFMGDVIWPGTFGAHGFAVPLSKYLPKSFFNQFAPGLTASASYKGQVYGAPFFQDQGFLFYRKDLLTAAHLPVPKTWQQLESESASLVKMGKVKYGFVWEGDSYEGGTCDFMEYYADTGGQVLNSTDTASALNVADVTKVLTFIRGLVTSGASPAAVDTFQEPEAMTAFQDGQAAFLRNWDLRVRRVQFKGQRRYWQGRRGPAADVRRSACTGLLQHRWLEPVYQPPLEEPEGRPRLHQIHLWHPGPNDRGQAAVLRDPDQRGCASQSGDQEPQRPVRHPVSDEASAQACPDT